MSIVHDIYNAFDANPSLEVRGVFLDISKVFDKVWHNGLLCKVKCMDTDGNLLKLMESFLSNRHQRVVPQDRYQQVCHKDQCSVLYFFYFNQ